MPSCNHWNSEKQIIRLNCKLQKEESIPETGSLRLHWEDKRYHWIEHFESSVASSEQDWILKVEPSVSEPINWYNGDLFSSILLLSANCRWWGQKSWIQLNKLNCKCPTYACHCKNWVTLLGRDGFGQIGYKNWEPNETQVEQSEKVLQAIINNFDSEIS